MSDEDVAEKAKRDGTTRAVASMEKACELDEKLIFAIGNAPTALIHLYELIRAGKIRPELVIGVPVGFVNVSVKRIDFGIVGYTLYRSAGKKRWK